MKKEISIILLVLSLIICSSFVIAIFPFNDIINDFLYTLNDNPEPQINIISPIQDFTYDSTDILINMTTNEISNCTYGLNQGSRNYTGDYILFFTNSMQNSTILSFEDPSHNAIRFECTNLDENIVLLEVDFFINTNHAPVIHNNFSIIQYGEYNKLYTLQINATDQDEGDLLSYDNDQGSKNYGLSVDENGLMSWTVANYAGCFGAVITVCDNSSRENSCKNQQFNIYTTNKINDAPVIYGLNDYESIPLNLTINQDQFINFTINASDEDEDDILELEYYKDSDLGTINKTTGYFEWIPTNDNVGTHNFKFTVYDGELSTNLTIPIIVNNLNEQPSLLTIQNKVIDEDSELSFIISADDTDLQHGDLLTYTSNMSDLLSITKAANQSQATITWTPINDYVGTQNVEFMVKDTDNSNDTKTIQITVNNVNDVPILSTQTLTIPEQSSQTINLTQYTTDIDSVQSSFTYNVTNFDDSLIDCKLDQTNNELLTIDILTKIGGVYTKCYVSTSDGTNSSENYITIVIESVDDAPILLKNIPNIEMIEDTPYTFIDLDDYFSDPDSNLRYSSTQTNNLTISISSSGIPTIVPQDNFFGQRKVKFIAISDNIQLESNEITINVNNDKLDNPIISNPLPLQQSLIIDDDKTQQFSIIANDPDEESLSIKWYVGDKLKQSTNSNTYAFNANLFDPGTYTIKVKITDPKLNIIEYSWTIKVSKVPITEDYNMDYNIAAGVDKAENVKITSTNKGEIDFGDQTIDLSNVLDIDNNIEIKENLIAINTEQLTALNKPATITMKVSSVDTPIIYYDQGFTTNKNDINNICDFCEIKSYDKLTGTLIFTVEHFTSFTAKEESIAYDLELSNNQIIFDGERETELIKEFTVTNIGDQLLEDIKLELIPIIGYDVSMKLETDESFNKSIPKFNLNPSVSKKIIIRSIISEQADLNKKGIGKIEISSKQLAIDRIVYLYQDPSSKLKIKNIEIDDGDDDYSIDNGDKITDIKPDSKLQFTFELENLYDDEDNDDYEIDSIEVEIIIKDILDDGDEDLDKDTISFSIEPNDEDEESLELHIPLEINNEHLGYDVEVIAEGKDGYGVIHKDKWNLELFIEKEDHDIKIIKSNLENSKLSCDNRKTYLDLKIKNYGDEDEKDVIIEVINLELEINEVYTNIPKLDKDVFDDDSEFSHSFELYIPEDTRSKKYPISINIYYDEDEKIADEIVYIDYEDCETIKSKEYKEKQVSPPSQKSITLKEMQTKTDDSSDSQEYNLFEFDDSFKTTLMICVFIIFIGIILFLIMALIMKKKTKRSY